MEQETTVVEQPKVEAPPPSEHEITEQYIEKRAKGETADLPVPPPTVPPLKEELPFPEEQKQTDAYITERAERERKKRGGKQARIDELTKAKAELEAKNAELAKQAEAAKAEPPKIEEPKVEAKPPETPVVPAVVETPKSKPKMNEFTDIDEYHAAMALWAQSEIAKPKPVVEAPPKAEPVAQIRQQEFDRFLEAGKNLMVRHPDFNTVLEAAHVRGLTMSEEARTAITRLAVPEVAYWLAKPENDLAARSLMKMDALQQVVEVGRIAERLKVSPSDFVSNAPEPGLRLTGGTAIPDVPLNQISDTDEYIRRRRQERRHR